MITMYWRDHPPGHFHASYGGNVAEVAIETLEVIDGWLPPRALRLVMEWAQGHQDELRENWTRARAHEQLAAVDPRPSIQSMVAVTHVQPLEGYKLRLGFDDGSERVVDLTDTLWGSMAEPLLDHEYFRRVRVDPELRTIVWPNGFDLDPDVLHRDHEPAAPLGPAHTNAHS